MKIKNILLVSTVSLGLLAFTFNPKHNSEIILTEVLNDTDTSKDNTKHKVVEVQPEYPGGFSAMMAFISKNFKYPEEAKKNNIKGKVLISFVVNEDGKIIDIEPLLPKEQQLGHGLEEEAMRVVSLMPNWSPGMQDGKPVKVRYTLPFYCENHEGVEEVKKEKKK